MVDCPCNKDEEEEVNIIEEIEGSMTEDAQRGEEYESQHGLGHDTHSDSVVLQDNVKLLGGIVVLGGEAKVQASVYDGRDAGPAMIHASLADRTADAPIAIPRQLPAQTPKDRPAALLRILRLPVPRDQCPR